jgi:hypothetical protein
MKHFRPKHNASKLHEDRLLEEYLKEKGGALYTEVRVGMGGARPRRIDAVRVSGGEAAILPFTRKMLPDFQKATRNRKIEVIEIKRRLNRPVIGVFSILRPEYCERVTYRSKEWEMTISHENLETALAKVTYLSEMIIAHKSYIIVCRLLNAKALN